MLQEIITNDQVFDISDYENPVRQSLMFSVKNLVLHVAIEVLLAACKLRLLLWWLQLVAEGADFRSGIHKKM